MPKVWTVVVAAVCAQPCVLTALSCANFPRLARQQFEDDAWTEGRCLRRAEDLHHWCGNDGSTSEVAATFRPTGLTQVYRPGACEPGWSLLGVWCFRHVWEKRDWWAAARACAALGAGLASILRSEVNSELNFSPNFEGLVLGCIDADFCK